MKKEADMSMDFAECLNAYMDRAGCTAAELAEASRISKSNISRYTSGKRVPSPESETPAALANALAALAQEKGREDLDAKEIRTAFSEVLETAQDSAQFAERFSELLDAFDVSQNQLAQYISFDPSYISRIAAGQRTPADLPLFIEKVATYFMRFHGDPAMHATAVDFARQNGMPEELADAEALHDLVQNYLSGGIVAAAEQDEAQHSFLEALNAFDLNDFLEGVHFDEIKVPSVPFQLPTSKTYEGIEEMKQAELDFYKGAVLSKSTDDIILYSDMPIEEMGEDEEFAKKCMMGLALLLRKGLHLHNIHNVHRPTRELFMGLEAWIPLYMTGQVSPYYLPRPTNTAFLHFLRSAGGVAVSGEAIAGNQGGGRYVVTKSRPDVAYYSRRAKELLAQSKPLLEVYFESDTAKLEAELARLERNAKEEPVSVGEGVFKNLSIVVWPHSHALIRKAGEPQVAFVTEFPALVNALEHYQLTLFSPRA